MIILDVSGTQAVIRRQQVLTTGLVGARVRFRFDSSWDGLSRIAVFRGSGVTCKATELTPIRENGQVLYETAIPHEVLALPGSGLEIGAYGVTLAQDGETVTLAIPTLWAKTEPIRSGTDPEKGSDSVPASPALWEQLLASANAAQAAATQAEATVKATAEAIRTTADEANTAAALAMGKAQDADEAAADAAEKAQDAHNAAAAANTAAENARLADAQASAAAEDARTAADKANSAAANAVLCTEQALTTQQQTQARENIGALGKRITEPVRLANSDTDAVILTGDVTTGQDDLAVDVLSLEGDMNGTVDTTEVLVRGVFPGQAATDAVNKGQLDAVSALTSQGRSANYYVYSPGWKRVLNIIRASSGSLSLGVAKARSGARAVQALGLELTGNVNFPAVGIDTVPVIYQRYDHEFGHNNSGDAAKRARISQVRIGYPTAEAEGDENYSPTNPVNCYVDVYVDFEPQSPEDRVQLNVNYAGFAESHNCEAITEETDATDTGIYGEALEFYTFTPKKDATVYLPTGSIVAKEVHADNIAFRRLIGTDENPIVVGELADGAYYITGIGKWYRSAAARQFAVGIYCVRQSGSYKSVCMLQINTIHRLRWYKVWENKYEETIIELDQIAEHEERLAALENALLVKFQIDTNADGTVARTARAGMTWAEYIDTGIMLNTCSACGESMDVECDTEGYVVASCPNEGTFYWLMDGATYTKSTDAIEAKTYTWSDTVPNAIIFSLDESDYHVTKGTTWEQLAHGAWHSGECTVCGGGAAGVWLDDSGRVMSMTCPYCMAGETGIVKSGSTTVSASDTIVANHVYRLDTSME